VGLVVVSEEDQQPLLVHRISREDIYQRQGGDTIITWTDPDICTDIALSFQEAVGCNYIWEQVKSVQMTYATNDEHGELPGRIRRGAVDEYEFGSAPGDGFYQESGRQGPNELPAAEFGNLEELVSLVADCSPFAREKIASLVMKKGYLRQLLDLFKTCEDLEDREGLHMMYRLVKGLVLLNDANLFDELLRDENVMDVVGALEYEYVGEELARKREDEEAEKAVENGEEAAAAKGGEGQPDGNDAGAEDDGERVRSGGEATVTTRPQAVRPPLPSPPQHRAFLRDSVVFKEVVPIQDEAIRAKIHQTYRIGYLKDVILPRVLDDATFGTLTSIMLFNNVEVVLALQQDPTFLKELFARLRKTPRTEPEWEDLVGFLQELCSLAKHLQVQQRGALFASLVQHGLFHVLTDVLQTDSETSQLKGADVLMSTLHNDPSALRAFLVKQDQHALFSRIVQLFIEGEEGLQAHLFELLKLMLDPDTMDQPVEKSGFLELFYERYVDRMILSICAGVRDEPPPFAGTPDRAGGDNARGSGSPVPAWTLVKTIELLCFCVQNHSFRIKYYVLRNNIVEKVLNLMQRREKYLVVAAVRFLRACVGLKDEFYNRYIIKNNLFAPVMKVFVANGDKYNLLNSAVLELVDFIRRENIKALVAHLVETYETMFSSVTYVDTFKLLKVKYEHRNQQEPGVAPSGEGRELVGLLGHTHAGAGEAGVLFSREAVAAQQAIETARRRRDGSMDKSEEDYFNSEDDEEENQMPALDLDGPGSPTGLPPLSGRFIPLSGSDLAAASEEEAEPNGAGEKRPLSQKGDEEDAGKRPKLGVDADGTSEEKPPEGEVSEPETEKEGGGADAGAE
jgi:protein phosphatase-4 regulatory subunit 3